MRFVTLLLVLGVCGGANAQDVDLMEGRDVFMTHCWQCHGEDATGNGPMAEMLAIETPDLTSLTSRNDGVFPVEAVARQIDGRSPILAHGGEMPIFGPFLESDSLVAIQLPSGQPMMTSLTLANLIAYLEAIQAQ